MIGLFFDDDDDNDIFDILLANDGDDLELPKLKTETSSSSFSINVF